MFRKIFYLCIPKTIDNRIFMQLSNYHSHCTFCDGRSTPEDFVKFAISHGFRAYGFSSHSPLPFETFWNMSKNDMPEYLAEIDRLKKKYSDRLEIYTALEIDYLDETYNPSVPYFQELPLDYRIGSVHMLYNDGSEVVDVDVSAAAFKRIVDEQFGGDLERVVRLYYGRLRRMLELGGFDIVGHADKMHYNAACYRPGLLDEVWYDTLVKEFFEDIAARSYQVEINTKSYHDLGTFYPNERYFPLLHSLGIRVQVNSDSHYPERINSGRPEALRALVKAGYKTVMELYDGKWQEMPIVL